MHISTKLLSAISLLSAFSNLHALTVDESVSGDLSGSFSNPDAFTLNLGINTVIGEIGANGNTGATDGTDADYFTFTVDPGLELTSINIDAYTPASGNNGSGSFFAYTIGDSFSGQGIGDIAGNLIFSASSGEVLDDLQQGSSTPLAAGDYSFWLQETGSTTVDYQISFTTAVVPEPSTPYGQPWPVA
ncbi:MAG: hypothetical protein AAF065_05380 [Verrucomicrobiota bacterium]